MRAIIVDQDRTSQEVIYMRAIILDRRTITAVQINTSISVGVKLRLPAKRESSCAVPGGG